MKNDLHGFFAKLRLIVDISVFMKEKMEYIAQAAEKVLKSNEIKKLNEREEINMLHRANVDAIDTREAMQIIEMRVQQLLLFYHWNKNHES